MSARSLVSRLATVGALVLTLAPSAAAQPPSHAPGSRNFDARTDDNHGRSFAETPAPVQAQAIHARRAQKPDLLTHFDPVSGTVRTVYNASGTLFDASGPYTDLYGAAQFAVEEHLDLLGLDAGDLDGQLLRDVVATPGGLIHLYFQQQHQGIPVYNGQLQVHMNGARQVKSINNDYVPGLSRAAASVRPRRDAADALAAVAAHLGLDPPAVTVLQAAAGDDQLTVLSAPGLSSETVVASLVWLPVRQNVVRLAWSFQVHTPGGEDVFDFTVDAVNNKVWTRVSWVSDATYKVYAQPVESPNHTSPLPPSDGRTTVTNPHLLASNASPQGWHSTGSSSWTSHRGNNVHAYEDRDGNDTPPASEVSCGSTLACSFTMSLSNAPSTYTSAAVTNLFYWNNVLHDVLYQYGFTEAAGNFQVNNFGKGGIGNDDVMAEAQSGLGTNNANFFTPVDGQRPRMRMYEWTHTSPRRDSDFDAGIVAHEYGHGVSNRLVGGPQNVSCLGNVQQMGEGWSDWLGLVLTARSTDTATQSRGVGTYVLGQATSGIGIRTQAYSTSQTVNNWTYNTISTGVSVPHGVGAVWSQALWEVYWKLVTKHGFDSNIYNSNGTKGNTRALRYVIEGMKNTACSPSFLQARDGIIQAVESFNNGQDLCDVWSAFAAFGLGSNASTPGGTSLTATNGFNVPTACQPFSVTINGPTSLTSGASGTWTSTVSNAPGAVTYQWEYRLAGGTWSNVGTGASYTRTAPSSSFELRLTVNSGTQTASDTHNVSVLSSTLSVNISGPVFMFRGTSGTWTANVSGASGTVTYQWQYKLWSGTTWSNVGTNSATYTRSAPFTDFELRVNVSTSTGQAASDTHFVTVDSTFPCLRMGIPGLTENLPVPEEPCPAQ
jgi:extracellular elastinolytic metalloproteinase